MKGGYFKNTIKTVISQIIDDSLKEADEREETRIEETEKKEDAKFKNTMNSVRTKKEDEEKREREKLQFLGEEELGKIEPTRLLG